VDVGAAGHYSLAVKEPDSGWPVARVEDDWTARAWKAVRLPLYAALLLVGLWLAYGVFLAASLRT
jgi:hypothetical protein